ncbi:hypothetical protein BN85403660 [Alteracholeplasma palmae J233]|uniref:Uncharacterized protein n=1 Tax=Alteracholeplasma palmae (strain ATCC 49389 / J233) TaxID=1318466 RepID=U4KKA0_ALTPJ|nr:hypothetical protein [Alteracholeplasma palmae]CCV63943.1 hypothetical protein BN85403660 [Alteracholeplasma palmae J233]
MAKRIILYLVTVTLAVLSVLFLKRLDASSDILIFLLICYLCLSFVLLPAAILYFISENKKSTRSKDMEFAYYVIFTIIPYYGFKYIYLDLKQLNK